VLEIMTNCSGLLQNVSGDDGVVAVLDNRGSTALTRPTVPADGSIGAMFDGLRFAVVAVFVLLIEKGR
jgi:hypothetical protein